MRLKFSEFLIVFVIVSVLLVGGCSTQQVSSETSSPSPTATEASTNATTQATTETTTDAKSVSEATQEAIPGMKDLPRLEGKATVVMTVKGSPITIEVDGTNAPITAGNFVDLVQRGVYDGLVFHRVIGPQSNPPQAPFVVQGGDPQSKDPKISVNRLGTGGFIDPKTGTERYIPLEIKPQGAKAPIYGKTLETARINQPPVLTHKLGAVAMARSQMPNSASSQFYFALADLGFLDGNYAVFGYVTEGMDVVNKIQQGDRIDSAKVTQGAENLKNKN
ncbi:peptidylprolyl isomerase [Fischerella thermalis]|jgi:peptidyl-prolyl cis-trans isomerase B (cyclophilin B)|uniref:Peptidyl-prolyl cis-trans isomerase n=1 Tax=Fischerella thermalis JSC-11 TaxID=741277 RepID=G6FZK8_9CYAN|nr:peptidylprolyl isomerase [Fischerella thermalis]PMB10768.1 peptidylprolyl isomerase [Fischerella thermalis CCMEE 5328]EHC08643.1 peptidyl-prolyl cis-trans isomerase cyclophilin type [Fischerella thermalis JSC-11]PLZ05151.1 peptidylprolyl isomerase [Fischerella thermalis WC114]PLZ10637.1 peptidylprolyl isomerase [Fischerella thermalis WC119]PLZ15076.1 peptidylprolyl isomerase [Fischerella thermalis WC1110]